MSAPHADPVSSLAEQIAGWSPPDELRSDPMSRGPALALHALLGGAPSVGTLPPLWHWVYFTRWEPLAALGPDGHPRSGGFLPPLVDRRRMFAGGRLAVHSPLRLGTTAQQRSSLAHVQLKEGRSGHMLLVTVRSEITQDGVLVVQDEQDLIYRSGPAASRPRLAAPPMDRHRSDPGGDAFAPDPVELFRFSALTANSHRIHYDLPYAREQEGYPGLLVHGPLQALVLAEQLRSRDKTPARFEYRLQRPLFAGESARIAFLAAPDGASISLTGPDETVRARATALYRADDQRID